MKATLTAFCQQQRIAQGELEQLIIKIKSLPSTNEPIFVFNDKTGARLEFNFDTTVPNIIETSLKVYPELNGEQADIAEETTVTNKSRGRPKLGVTAKEITLLPRQWAWLATQPGGASATIRRLVDEAKKLSMADDLKRNRLTAAYKFLNEVAGNLPDYEASLRALFADDQTLFLNITKDWPNDIQQYANQLAFIPNE
ncbi:DUF2239 family protein [Proteus sp. GOKU]|uniref:DUF2239 family protein n=1 Tax=Proteus TaxID=583 RepID=UPI001892A532|nr:MULTISPECIES: DUF2239 family protein [Proteus]QPB79525.1 DUF2239 family protein [Proteus sp. GOKU]QQP25532.1 DUF2239 family protein [Proteus vulgaris]